MAINPASKKWLADSISRMQFDERLIAAKDGWDQKEISIRSVKGQLPTLMHCAPRTQIPRISCYTILPIVVKGLSKDLVSFQRLRLSVREKLSFLRTTQAIHWKKLSSVRTAPFETIVSRAIVPNRSPEPFATNLSRDVSLNNSSKSCLLSSHEFSRYIFC